MHPPAADALGEHLVRHLLLGIEHIGYWVSGALDIGGIGHGGGHWAQALGALGALGIGH